MSKLFDQLKSAAREREGGLLLDALAKAQESKPAAPAQTVAQAGAQSPPASSHTALAGIAVAAVIFAGALVAWHGAPQHPLPSTKVKIDAGKLKLERSLDLTRMDAAARSSPRDPPRSKSGRSAPR